MTEFPPKHRLNVPVEILARRQDTGAWVLCAVEDTIHYTAIDPVIARAYAHGYDAIKIRTQDHAS